MANSYASNIFFLLEEERILEKRHSWFLVTTGKSITPTPGGEPSFPVETLTRCPGPIVKSTETCIKSRVWFEIHLCYQVRLSAFLTALWCGSSSRDEGPLQGKLKSRLFSSKVEQENFFCYCVGLFKNMSLNTRQKISKCELIGTIFRYLVLGNTTLLMVKFIKSGFGTMRMTCK